MSDLKFKMRPSRVLAKLRAGKPVFCTKSNLIDPRSVELAAMFGFSKALPKLTGGRGAFSMEPHGYRECQNGSS